MKKRSLILCGALAFGVALGGFALAACGETEEPDPPQITETVRYSEKTNPYKDVTWQEIKDITDWTEKAKDTSEIYYQFEGSYSEAYQENYSRNFMLMNCYKDGGLHATFGNENYYGYWTNVDRKGKTLVSLHVLRYQDSQYNNGAYDVICESMSHDYYEYSSNMPIIMFTNQMRSCLISGGHYSQIESLTVEGGQTACVLGDSFSTEGLQVTINREDGKSILIDSQWYGKGNCPVTFSGFDSSVKGDTEVTLSYKNTDVTAKYNCSVMGLKGITLDTSKIKANYHVGDELDTTGLVVNATRDDDGISAVEARRYKIYGFDSKTEGEKTLTVKYDDKDEHTATFTVNVYGIKSLDVDSENVKKEYFVGDKIDLKGLVVNATFNDDLTDEIDVGRVTIEGFDTSAATESQEVTVKYQGLSQTYNIKVVAPEYTGTGKYGETKGDVKLKIVTPTMCEFTFDGKTTPLGYTTLKFGNTVVYGLAKATDMTITDDEFAGLHKQFALDSEDMSLSMITVYEIPDDDYGEGSIRFEQEPMPGIGGYTELRFVLIDEDKGQATITYKYWNGGNSDTFVCKYTIEGNIFTFTDLISQQVGGSGANYSNLYKTWQMNEDFTMTKYKPAA